MYSFRERLQKEGDKIKMMEIVLFCMIFSLIAVRMVCNYKSRIFVEYSWKTQAAVFDRQGDVFYNFPINPYYCSVGFPSSVDRNNYIPQFWKKFIIDDSHIASINDLVLNDSLYTVTGSHPSVCYQLQGMPVFCCWINFDRSIDVLQMVFISETEERHPMLFHVEKNNLINMNKFIQEARMKFVQFDFYNPMYYGSFALPDSSFVIKQLHFYTLPDNKK
jgi:hypothetical protein